MAPTTFQGGRFAIAISFIALIFSAISLYETLLKRADPTLHVGGVIHYAHDILQPRDVFMIPVTITNGGARDAIIVDLHLSVSQRGVETGQEVQLYSRYTGTNPRTDKRPFAPISVPGRGAFSGAILFYRDRVDGQLASPLVSGNQALRFCLSARAAPSGLSLLDWTGAIPSPRIAFDGEVVAFSREDLTAGRTIPIRLSERQTLEPVNREETRSGC